MRNIKDLIKKAQELKKEGWLVRANVEGFESPEEIANNTPDIIASIGTAVLVIVVKSPNSHYIDKSKIKAFEDYADRSANTVFQILSVNDT